MENIHTCVFRLYKVIHAGATFIEDCSLLSVHTDKHRRVVTSLDTSEGEIKCDYFINAAGQVGISID